MFEGTGGIVAVIIILAVCAAAFIIGIRKEME